MATYIAILRKDDDSDYGVDVSDLPGCVTAGSTLEEARKNAAEAIRFHLIGMIEDGEDLPVPCSLDAIVADPSNLDGVPFFVDVDLPSSKAFRINITLPTD